MNRMAFNDPIYGQIKITEPVLVKITDRECRKLNELDLKYKSELAQALARRKQGNYVKIIPRSE